MEPELLRQYKEFCTYRNSARETGKLDLTQCKWLSPTMLLPLSHFVSENERIVLQLPILGAVSSYFKTACAKKPAVPTPGQTYIPIVILPKDPSVVDQYLSPMYSTNNQGRELGGQDAFKYFFGELICNIYEHAECTCAKVMAQKYDKIATAEMCLFDNGMTINGSYKKKRMIFEEDYDAIIAAVNGTSSKDEKERGFGISTNYAMWTKGANAELLIVSGNGAIYVHGTQTPNVYKLETPFHLQGTLISVRYKFPVSLNVYKYASGSERNGK